MKPMFSVLLSCLALSILVGCTHSNISTATHTDFRIKFEDRIVGHIRETRQILPQSVRTTLLITLPTQFRGLKKINNQILDIQEEDRFGNPVFFSHKIDIPNAKWSITGDIKNNTLVIRETRGDIERESQLTIPRDFIFTEELRKRLSVNASQNTFFSIQEFDFENLSFQPISFQIFPNPADSKGWKLVRSNRDIISEYYVDDKFIPEHYSFKFLGKLLSVERCIDLCFMEKFSTFKPLDYQLVPSPYKITDSALKGHIRYTIQSLLEIPSTPSQKPMNLKNNLWRVDVCKTCNDVNSFDKSKLDDFLKITKWLEADDKRLITFAQNKTLSTDLPYTKMQKLTHAVRNRLEKKPQFSGYASALQSFNSRSGDCTEYAVLLAALGRAVQIPTRIVFGLSYSREEFHGKKDQFVPHAWVEALIDNRWVSFDAAFETFDAGHIALQISDGNPNDFQFMIEHLNELKIVSANQITSRTTN